MSDSPFTHFLPPPSSSLPFPPPVTTTHRPPPLLSPPPFPTLPSSFRTRGERGRTVLHRLRLFSPPSHSVTQPSHQDMRGRRRRTECQRGNVGKRKKKKPATVRFSTPLALQKILSPTLLLPHIFSHQKRSSTRAGKIRKGKRRRRPRCVYTYITSRFSEVQVSAAKKRDALPSNFQNFPFFSGTEGEGEGESESERGGEGGLSHRTRGREGGREEGASIASRKGREGGKKKKDSNSRPSLSSLSPLLAFSIFPDLKGELPLLDLETPLY